VPFSFLFLFILLLFLLLFCYFENNNITRYVFVEIRRTRAGGAGV